MNIFQKLMIRCLFLFRKTPKVFKFEMKELPLEKQLYLAAYKANFKYMSKKDIEDNFIQLLELYMVKEELLKQLLKEKVSGETSVLKQIKWHSDE